MWAGSEKYGNDMYKSFSSLDPLAFLILGRKIIKHIFAVKGPTNTWHTRGLILCVQC